MPQITENTKLKDNFLQKLSEKYGNQRNGIHASNLVYCLRETFARKYMPQPQTLQTLFYFLDGDCRHKGFQGLVPELENEKEVENFGIIGTMDLFSNEQIIEIKSTRAKPRAELSPHYLRQGAYYCLLTGKTKFTLVTQHINHGDIIFYDIEFTSEELSDYSKDMLGGRDILLKAYEEVWNLDIAVDSKEEYGEGLMRIFDSIPMARPSLSWKCNTCLYKSKCYIEKEESKEVEKECVKKGKKKIK
jgi:hypothetical protein